MIKRFRYDFKSGIVADGKGDFISYAEYEVLRQKLVALTEQRDALVVENVAMKSFRKSLEDIRSSLIGGGRGYMAVSDMQAQNAVLDVVFDEFDEIDTPATDAAIAALREEATEAAFNSDKHAALCDSAYVSGMQAGWNFGVDEDVTGFQQSLEAYRKPMRETCRQLRESKGEVSNG